MRLSDYQYKQEADRMFGRVVQLSAQLDRATERADALEAELESLRVLSDLFRADVSPPPPEWLTAEPSKPGDHRGTLVSILSDLHLDEVVRRSETDGLNVFNRRVAEQRIERYVNNLISLARNYLSGLTYDGMVLLLGGDLVSGSIHDELAQTNEQPLPATIAYWTPRLVEVLRRFADEFGRVHVASVVGNHGRLTRKPRAKLRALDNADWLIAKLVAANLQDDQRVTFDIPDGTDALVQVYSTTFLLTHGDQATGGQGIGGIWPPVKRLEARKRDRYSARGITFDWLVMGHWHQYVHAQGMIVNGSLKGYDEYAATNNFPPERPQQAMWVVTPENGVTFAAPVFVDGPIRRRRRRAAR